MDFLWGRKCELLAKQIEEIYGNFPQEITPPTLNGLLSEWVEIKNMMRKSFSCLSAVDFIEKFVALDSCDNVSEQMEPASDYPNFLGLVKLVYTSQQCGLRKRFFRLQ